MGATATRVSADGSEIVYTYKTRGGVTAYWTVDGSGSHDKMNYAGGAWTWTDGDTGVVERYAAVSGLSDWRLDHVQDRDGNQVSYSYVGGKLSRITTADGGYLKYSWSGNTITSIETYANGGATKTQTRTYYSYDSYDRLTRVRTDLSPEDNSISDGQYYDVNYTYSGSSTLITRITQSDGSRLDFSYDAPGRIYDITQHVGDGTTRVTKLRYASTYTNIYDPSGTRSILYYDSQKQLTRSRLYAPSQGIDQSNYFTYDSSGNVLSVRDAEANVTAYEYDVDGNVTTVTDPSGQVRNHRYDDQNNLIRTNYKASTTVSYDRILLEHFIYDSKGHLRYVIDGAQQVTEYRYDGYGNRTYEIDYTQHTYAHVYTTPTVADLDAWRDGLDRTESQLTRHFYDAKGNLVRSIDYGDTIPIGHQTVDEGYTDLRYTYDSSGRLLSSKAVSHIGEAYVYDGLGRTIRSTNGESGATTITFNDAAMTTTVTSSIGGVVLSTYNKAGELISVHTSGAHAKPGTARYAYDKDGRTRVVTDETGYKTYHVYDEAGRKTAEVDHSGYVQEFRYDDKGRQIAHARYTRYKTGDDLNVMLATLADPNNSLISKDLLYSSDPVANHHAYDIWEWSAYDDRGSVTRTVLGDGSVTAYEYDKAGQLIKSHSYYNKLGSSRLAKLRAGTAAADAYLPTANSAKDQVERTFYDDAGRIAGTLNGEGYLTQTLYDAAGRETQKSAYANLTSSTHRASGTFNQLYASVIKSSAQDAHMRYVYDGQGHLRFKIDAGGKVTESVYFDTTKSSAIGLVRATISHAATLSAQSSYDYTTVKAAVAALGIKGDNRTNWAVHNTRQQLVYSIDATGAVTRLQYDVAGNVTKTTQYAVLRDTTSLPTEQTMNGWAAGNGADARVTRHYYNAIGQLRFAIDAEGYVTETSYDAAGRVYNVYRYTKQFTPSDSWTTATVDVLDKERYARTQYRYATNGQLKYVYDPVGNLTYYIYYANGERSWQIQAYGQGADESRILFANDATGRRAFTRHYQGDYRDTSDPAYRKYRETHHYYDGLGNEIRKREASGEHIPGSVDQNTHYDYDRFGNLTKQTDAEGGITLFEHNAFGQVTQITDPGNAVTTNSYDKAGQLTRMTDALGHHTDFTYTAFGERFKVTRAGATTTHAYDKLGRATKVTDAMGYATRSVYDAFGNVVEATNQARGKTYHTYDKRGLLIETRIPASNTRTVESRTTFSYDSRGNRLQMVEAAGRAEARTTHYTYDLANQLTRVRGDILAVYSSDTDDSVSNLRASESYKYDRRGNLIESETALGARTLYYYDEMNRVTHKISPTGTLTYNIYDANSNLLVTRVHGPKVTLPADATGMPPQGSGPSRTTSFTYDKLNRMTESRVHDVQTASFDTTLAITATNNDLVTQYLYDDAGNVVRVTDPNGNHTHSYYDDLGRKTHQVDAENYLTIWRYNAAGNVFQERRYAQKVSGTVDTSSIGTVTHNYPSNDAAVAVDQAYRDRITDYTYDANNRRLTETRRNALTHDENGDFQVRSSRIEYTYNALGQVVTKRQATGDTKHYQFDNQGRLYTEYRDTYTDSSGNVVQPRFYYTYNGNNDLVQIRHNGTRGVINVSYSTFTYGLGGRLESQTDASGFTRTFRYDAAGQVVREEYVRVTPQGNRTEARGYEYDLEGRIVAQGIVAKPGSSWTEGGTENDTITTTYNAFGEVAKRGLNGTNSEQFSYDKAGRVFRTTTGDGTWKYFFYDNNGNQTVALASAGTAIDLMSPSEILGVWGVGVQGQSADNIRTRSVGGVTATLTRYDGRNQAIQVHEPNRKLDGTTTADLDTERGYNAFGDVVHEIDVKGARIDYSYNTMGRRIRVESPTVSVTGEDGVTTTLRPTELSYYDVSGRLVASRDANGHLTRQQLLRGTGHDGTQALITQTTAADGGITKTEYDIHGNARVITDPLGRVTTQDFDLMGRITQVDHAGGLTEHFAYDGLGQRIQHWNNHSGDDDKALTTYDAQGRVIQQRAFGGDVTSTTHMFVAGLDVSGLRNNVGGWQVTTTYANGKTKVEKSSVFGQTTETKDMGGHVTSYVYDRAGWLTSTSGAAVQAFTYLNTGRLRTHVNDGKVASYGYDRVGNLTSETLRAGSRWLRDASASYDALGRLTVWSEAGSGAGATAIPSASVAFAYDAAGNIRSRTEDSAQIGRDQTVYDPSYTTPSTWYRYDAMNRIVTEGRLAQGAIVRGYTGRDIEYDAAGQRRVVKNNFRDSYQTTTWEPGEGYGTVEEVPTTHYFDNTDKETYGYDAAGRLDTVHRLRGTRSDPDPSGSGVLRGNYDYDLLGRQTRVREWSELTSDGNPSVARQYQQDTIYDAKGRIASETTFTVRDLDTWKTITTNSYGTGGAYALGQVVSSTTRTQKNLDPFTTSETRNSHVYHDGAVSSRIVYDPDTSTTRGGLHTTTFTRDGSGDLLRSHIDDGRPRTVHFVTDTAGQVVERREASSAAWEPREVRHRFGGREMGLVGNNGQAGADLSFEASVRDRTTTPADNPGPFRHGLTRADTLPTFKQGGYEALNSYNQGSTAGAYTARGGESLSGLAASLYGDASLWYKIAQANPGVGAQDTLIAGQSVRLPAGVSRNGYNASTLTPYDPAAALGDLSPTTPAPPKAQKGGCGALGQILLVVVAVAVTVLTKNLALGAKVFKAGTTAAAITTGATAAAAGSVASQAVGVATGIQDKFNWKSVGLAAISGGVGGGITNRFGEATNFGGGLLRGATSSAIVQGIGVATGLQESFGWAGVAAAGVGAGVGASALGRSLGRAGANFGEIGASVGQSTASAIANAATRSALEGSNFADNIAASIPDVVGQAVGNAVGSALSGPIAAAMGDPVSEGAAGTAGQAVDGPLYAQTTGTHYREDEVIVTARRRAGLSFGEVSALNFGAQRDAAVGQVAMARGEAAWIGRMIAREQGSIDGLYGQAYANAGLDALAIGTAQSRFGAIGSAEVAIGRHARAIAEPELMRQAVLQYNDSVDGYNQRATFASIGQLHANIASAQGKLAGGLSFMAGPVGWASGAVLTGEQIASGQFTTIDAASLVLLRGKGRAESIGGIRTSRGVLYNGMTAQGPLRVDVASTFRSSSYTEIITSEPITLYRAYGGKAGPLSQYWSRTAPSGPMQATIDSALLPKWGNKAQSVSTIRVPTGTKIYEGIVGSQGGLLGGGNQVVIPRVNPNWLILE